MSRILKTFIIEGGDLVIENGTFKIADSGQQSLQLNLQSFPGDWITDPLVGGAVEKDLNSPGPFDARTSRNAKLSLERDGWRNVKFVTDADGITQVYAKR